MAKTATEVMVQFHSPPQEIIARMSIDHSHNYIRIRFNPEEIIALGAAVRKEGESEELEPVEMTVSRQGGRRSSALREAPAIGDVRRFAACLPVPTLSKPSGRSSNPCWAT